LFDIIETECQSDPVKINNQLEEIYEQMKKFMKKNNVWDREYLMQSLNMSTDIAGNFVCLLGGKSTGKSLVLKQFSLDQKKNKRIIYVNMREYSGIIRGLVDALSKSKIIQFKHFV
jgi:predicted AAA+ superfamily ATPase